MLRPDQRWRYLCKAWKSSGKRPTKPWEKCRCSKQPWSNTNRSTNRSVSHSSSLPYSGRDTRYLLPHFPPSISPVTRWSPTLTPFPKDFNRKRRKNCRQSMTVSMISRPRSSPGSSPSPQWMTWPPKLRPKSRSTDRELSNSCKTSVKTTARSKQPSNKAESPNNSSTRKHARPRREWPTPEKSMLSTRRKKPGSMTPASRATRTSDSNWVSWCQGKNLRKTRSCRSIMRWGGHSEVVPKP